MCLLAIFATVLTLEPTNDRFGVTPSGETHGGAWVTPTRFEAESPLDEAVRVDFTAEIVDYAGMAPEEPAPGVGALVPARFDDGLYGCWCWGDGLWLPLTCDAVGQSKTVEGRLETRTLGDEVTVAYFVKVGGAYVQLKTASGRGWFRGGEPAAVRGVASVGEGRLGAFTGLDAPIASGDYEVQSYPGTGVTTIDGASAQTTNLKVLVETNAAPVVIGGVVRPVVSLDTDSVRIGKPLVATADVFLGLDFACTYTWTKGAATFEGSRYEVTAADDEQWLRFCAFDDYGLVDAKDIYVSQLPVLYLTTDDGLAPTAEKETHTGMARVQGNAAWAIQYDGKMEIKVRGNSSAGKPKKPYKLKLDKKTKMFGFPKNKHWVLLANYTDGTQMRNRLAYDLANEIGSLGMRSTWVTCVLNGQYQGVYQFCEHIRADPDRVPIHNWEDDVEDETDLSSIDPATADITGGYLFEFSMEMDAVSQFTTTAGKLRMQTMIGSPEYLKTNPAMMSWVKGYLQNYWDACVAASRKSKDGFRYRHYADVESMANYLLVYELFGNYDGARKSRFAYKAHGEKLKFGPVWDFDHCSGEPEGWQTMWSEHSMFLEWTSDQYFCKVLRNRYRAIRLQLAQLAADGGTIDTHAAQIAAAIAADNRRWNNTSDFAVETAALKDFLMKRLAWFDTVFTTVESTMAAFANPAQTNPTAYDPNFKYPGGFIFTIR